MKVNLLLLIYCFLLSLSNPIFAYYEREFKSFASEGIIEARGALYASSLMGGSISSNKSNAVFLMGHYLDDWQESDSLLGMAYNYKENRIIIVSRSYQGGSILSICLYEMENLFKNRKMLDRNAVKVHVVEAGLLNDLKIHNGNVYVTSSEAFSGKLLKFDLDNLMKDRSRELKESDTFVTDLNFANGLFIHKGELFVCLTSDQVIMKVNLETKAKEVFADLGDGWPDDIIAISNKLFIVSDNQKGRLILIDNKGDIKAKFPLKLYSGDFLKPANLLYDLHKGRVIITNLWDSNLAQILYSDITGHDINSYLTGVYSVKFTEILRYKRKMDSLERGL